MKATDAYHKIRPKQWTLRNEHTMCKTEIIEYTHINPKPNASKQAETKPSHEVSQAVHKHFQSKSGGKQSPFSLKPSLLTRNTWERYMLLIELI